MSSIETEISFITEFDRMLRHVRNLESESSVGSLSTKQLLKELGELPQKASSTLAALKKNRPSEED